MATKLTEHDKAFFGGTLAALDVVYCHDHPTCTMAAEIVRAVGATDLLAYAQSAECGYHNLANLRMTVKWATRRA